MNDLEKVLNSARSISSEIGEILKLSTYDQFDDMSGLKIDYEDAEQLFLLDELRGIIGKLDKAKLDIDYLNCPIKHISTLKKNSRGRYETECREYTSGSGIEVFVYDDYDEREHWVKTRVEHNGEDYYLVGYKTIPMQGLKVRVREK